MRIFEPRLADGQQWVVPSSIEGARTLRKLDGSPRAKNWKPIQMVFLNENDDGSIRQPSEFPWLSAGTLILKERAKGLIAPLVESDAEVLPLASDIEHLWALNVVRVLDILDEDNCEIIRGRTSGAIIDIDAYAFRNLPDQTVIFKIPQMNRSVAFVTDVFVEAVRSAGLGPIDFRLIWDSERSEPIRGVGALRDIRPPT